MIKALMAKDMVAQVPETEIPSWPHGTLVSGQWFCVDYTNGGTRRIFDRRPQNSTEIVLSDWMDLPLESQLIHLVVDPFETERGSGVDLECFFYTLSY